MEEKSGHIAIQQGRSTLTRRRLLQGAGGLIAASALAPNGVFGTAFAAGRPAESTSAAASDLTGQLARYMVAARDRNLPPKALLDTKHCVLDSLAAIVSGSHLKPGEMAIRYIRAQGGVPEASVITTDIKTSMINAALVNGMFAHADETDDVVSPPGGGHPGSAVVPAVLAMAEREQRSGMEALRAVALGYDVGCRFIAALGADLVRSSHRGSDAPVSTMGAMAAAASLARLDETGMRYAIS